MTRRTFAVAALLTGLSSVAAAQPNQADGEINRAAIDAALGKSGTMQGGVYKISFPRTDLQVSIGGLRIRPALALGSWMAFRRAERQTVAHGDLVLLEAEVNPVISKLQAGGMEITALHNHVLDESPRVMYLHFWGRGEEAALARTLRIALDTTKTPIGAQVPSTTASAGDSELDARRIQEMLGHEGNLGGGVLSVAVPRPERITMMGVELPPSMGMATALNFQDAGAGKVAATGDFVLLGDEVNTVARALRDHGIAITALHSHMIHGEPTLYFMHFWAVDAAEKVATGLKAGLGAMKTAGRQP